MSSIIIRTKDSKKKNPKTQAYTWASCIIVLVFLVSIFVTVSSAKNGKGSSQENYKHQMYDLNRMPFSDDAAERMLLASAKYEDISARGEYLHTLFSESDKEARQRADILQGITTEDVVTGKDAKKDKADPKNKNAKGKKNKNSKNGAAKAPTAKGSLRSSSLPSYSGGGSGKGGVYSSNSYGGNNNAGHAVMTASLKGDAAQSLGRVSAYSAMAADTDDVEKAAAGAIAGFEEGAVKESEAFLNGENEKAALATQIDEDNLKDKLDAAAATPDLDKLNTKLKEKKQQQDKQDKTCDQDPFGSWGCALSEILSFGASIFGSMIGAFF